MEGAGGHEAVVDQLVAAGFERHAAEVAAMSANGNAEQAFALILSWDGAPPPPLPGGLEGSSAAAAAAAAAAAPAAAAASGGGGGRAAASALRLSAAAAAAVSASAGAGAVTCGERPGAAATDASLGARAKLAPGPAVPSLRATEAEHRQRVFEKQRELEAKKKKQQRGEAKRRREQELAIWKEQRDEAKQRKGGGSGGAAQQKSPAGGRAGGEGGDEEEREVSLSAPAEAQAVVVMRLPDGTSATHTFRGTALLRDVVSWLRSTETTAEKVHGKEVELRCPFPPPGLAVAGDDLDSTTVEGVGLCPRGRLMVQFSGEAGIKQGEGEMPTANNRRGRFCGGGGIGRGRGRGGPGLGVGRGRGLIAGRGGGGGGGGRGGRGGGRGGAAAIAAAQAALDAAVAAAGGAYEGDDPEEAGGGIGGIGGIGGGAADHGNNAWGQQEDDDDDGMDEDGEGEAEAEGDAGFGVGPALGGGWGAGGGGFNSDDGGDEDEDDDDDDMGGGGLGVVNNNPLGGGGAGGAALAVLGAGNVLGGAAGGVSSGADGEDTASAQAQAAAMREQRLARLAGARAGGGGGGAGGNGDGRGDSGAGAGGGGGRGVAAGRSKAEVGTLQDILVESICQRMRSGGAHQAITYGSLDAATGGRILQRLIDLRALTPGMLAAFRGCPVGELSLDRNPRVTNALLAELGRKVSITSLSLAHDDMVTVEGMESLVGLRALVTLDISGCKANDGWLKAIAKLPALESLVLRGCNKVADLGILSLSRGAPALTSLDLSGCTGVTDAGVAHLSSMVVAAAGEGGGSGRERGRLECLRLDGLIGLSDDGLDVLLGNDGTGGAGGGPSSSASSLAARAAAARFAAAATGATEAGGGAASLAADDAAASAPGGPSSRLHVLSVSGCRGITDAGLARIGACLPLRASLRELDLSGTSATEVGVTRLLDPSSASQASAAGGGGGGAVVGTRVVRLRLESLVLPSRGRGLSGVGLAALSTGLTSLLGLDLEGCGGPGVTPQALSGVARLVLLRSLSVANVHAFDDDALKAVCSACHSLRLLNLNGTAVKTAAGLALIGSSLRDLCLARTHVDDDTMDAVASLPSLTTLNLRGTAVTGVGVARLHHLSNLRSLILTGTRAAQEGGEGGGRASSAVESLRASTAALNIRL
eukprot:g17863.t1